MLTEFKLRSGNLRPRRSDLFYKSDMNHFLNFPMKISDDLFYGLDFPAASHQQYRADA